MAVPSVEGWGGLMHCNQLACICRFPEVLCLSVTTRLGFPVWPSDAQIILLFSPTGASNIVLHTKFICLRFCPWRLETKEIFVYSSGLISYTHPDSSGSFATGEQSIG